MVCASAYGRFAGSSPALATSSCHCITGFPPLGSGRSDWIRTSDFDVPNVALYQAELRSDRGAESIAGRWRRLGSRHPAVRPHLTERLLGAATTTKHWYSRHPWREVSVPDWPLARHP